MSILYVPLFPVSGRLEVRQYRPGAALGFRTLDLTAEDTSALALHIGEALAWRMDPADVPDAIDAAIMAWVRGVCPEIHRAWMEGESLHLVLNLTEAGWPSDARRGRLRAALEALVARVHRGEVDEAALELFAQEVEVGQLGHGGPAERARVLADREVGPAYGTPVDLTTAESARSVLLVRARPRLEAVLPCWTEAELLDLAELIRRLAREAEEARRLAATWKAAVEPIAAAEARGRQEERDACALLAEGYEKQGLSGFVTAHYIARDIRTRSGGRRPRPGGERRRKRR